MNLQAPIAGPSRPRPPTNLYSSRSDPPSSSSRASTPSHHHKSSTPFEGRYPTPALNHRYSTSSLSGRSSTPIFYPNGARFRSQSVLSTSQKEDELINKKRLDSFHKLKSSWDLLKEKYGSISLEDDDEIDLRTGKVVKDRGRLREYVGRDFGEVSDTEETQTQTDGESKGEGYEIDSDEDEIGLWDERSGLDPQVAEPPLLWEVERNLRRTKSWVSEEDQDDLKEFLSMEAQRNRLLGNDDDDDVSEDEGVPEPESEELNYDDRESREESRFRGTRILPVSATLDDLFASDQDKEDTSEDELQLIDSEGESGKEVFNVNPTPKANDINDDDDDDDDDDPFLQDRPASPSPSPPPRRRGKTLEVEVVIPLRPRRKSLPAPTVYVSQPQPPAAKRIVKPSVSAPSSIDLFRSPPPEDDLCSRSPSWSPLRSPSRSPSPVHHSPATRSHLSPAQDGHDRQSAIVLSPSPPPRQLPPVRSHSPSSTTPRATSLTSVKGKERMAGERPDEIVQPTPAQSDSPYYTRVWKTPSGVVRVCKRCRKAGGVRAEKAPLCKGRVDLAKCTFERTVIDLDRTTQSNRQIKAHRPLTPYTTGQSIINAEDGLESLPSDHNTISNTPEQSSPGEKHRKSHKRCLACKEAGGERAKKSGSCPGGFKRRWCHWYEAESEQRDTVDVEEENQSTSRQRSRTSVLPDIPLQTNEASDTDNTPLKLRKSRNRRKSMILTSDSEPDSASKRPLSHIASTPMRTPTRAASEFAGTPSDRPADLDKSIYASALIYRSNGRARYCGACHEAGGIRAERAWWCKGRAWAKFCHFLRNYDVSNAEDEGGSPISKVGRKTPEVVIRSSSVMRTKRKRVVSTDAPQIPSSPSPTLRNFDNASHMPSPPPTSSVEPYSPNLNTSFSTSRPIIGRDSSSFSSMPPSSPPVFAPSNRPVHPTPSPSLSAAPIEESPVIQRISKPYLPPRGQTIGFGPTPPPSIDGARSSSTLSDNVPLTLPRKSILRKPSESPYSTSSGSGSVKRARFSLQPRSPAREESSDPLHQEVDQPSEDELSIHDGMNHYNHYSSSPVAATSSSPAFNRYSISSSPLRNEWSVRAADIGMNLGPEHTGALPKGMIRALVPSLAKSTTATLGSSVNRNFNLPTPPTSSSSTSSSSTAVRNRNNTSSPALGGNRTPNAGAGLMLPPPVPLKRSTPGPAFATSSRSDSVSARTADRASDPLTPSTPRQKNQPIKFTSLPRSHIQSRSRSRSISIQPSSSSGGSRLSTPSYKPPIREVSSTPRKKSRVEIELARKALELGDEAGLEWGLDEDTEDGGRMWREGSVALLRSEL
ncbi:hypothetical protein I302_101461 [Kwoniella bestiolae CBS 10118]|uniref:Uncharacterized protein n=1 Tax=Kwoniella bestiolae CBS 10118 TaxID=1296100 RepID=A0A1B9GCB8_9TREE|nr:hypothetical protein I302_00144 [Kwoniella bestiolae CBS 10118]OCF28655.1 hypothetical protein I302_00144 [Kwoniella bestiolae CBS 10118]